MDTVDAIVLGRNTFELVLTFDTWPYSGKNVVVLSSRPSAIPPYLVEGVGLKGRWFRTTAFSTSLVSPANRERNRADSNRFTAYHG